MAAVVRGDPKPFQAPGEGLPDPVQANLLVEDPGEVSNLDPAFVGKTGLGESLVDFLSKSFFFLEKMRRLGQMGCARTAEDAQVQTVLPGQREVVRPQDRRPFRSAPFMGNPQQTNSGTSTSSMPRRAATFRAESS